MDASLERYQKQILFSGIGKDGQHKLLNSKVLLCGCGALGSVIADTLTRAGVGFIRLVDRDFVEFSNLQRQVLYDEVDVEQRLPKAVAAANKLRAINSSITIEPIVADISHTNILEFADGVDLILDGTDNFEIRFLINDVSLELGIPWIYTGCIGAWGQTMPVFPGESACLRCLMDTVPEPGSTETCDTAGVIAPAINVLSSLECVTALKILTGQADQVERALTIVDVWDMTMRQMQVGQLREKSQCPACFQGERLWLTGQAGAKPTVLCGRNAVQISPPSAASLDLNDLGSRLQDSGTVTQNAWLLRLAVREPDYDITVFPDGRAIIKGTDDVAVARSVYARYIGS